MNTYLQTTRDVVNYTTQFIKGRTLDLGAGSAKYRNIIKPHTTTYTTFDMVAGPHIDVVGDILNLPLEDGSFDSVISTQVLEHVEKPWVMIQQIRRVLAKGGTCILSAPFLIPYHADPHDYFRYTVTGLSSLFKNEGFEIVECKPYGRIFSTVTEFIHFFFFNHYENPARHKRFEKFIGLIQKIARKLDVYMKDSNIYANVYIVARKK